MADCNIRLGDLVLTGTDVKRDVPIGSEIEVTLRANEPGNSHVTAYIPVLDEEFEVKIDYLKATPNAVDLEKGLSKGL